MNPSKILYLCILARVFAVVWAAMGLIFFGLWYALDAPIYFWGGGLSCGIAAAAAVIDGVALMRGCCMGIVLEKS